MSAIFVRSPASFQLHHDTQAQTHKTLMAQKSEDLITQHALLHLLADSAPSWLCFRAFTCYNQQVSDVLMLTDVIIWTEELLGSVHPNRPNLDQVWLELRVWEN